MAGATSYNLEVSTQTNFSSLYLNVNVPTSNTFIVGGGATVVGYTPSSDLPVDTTFYWQVEALGTSPYSPSGWGFCGSGNCSFNTGLAASPAPVPVQMPPVGKGVYTTGKVTNDFTPGLLWDEIALPGGTTFTTYEVQVSTDNTFLDNSAQCFDVTSTQVPSLANQTYPAGIGLTTVQFDTGIALAASSPGTNCPTISHKFAPTTVYYWRVHAQDSGGYSDWSNVYKFVTSYPKVNSATFTTTGDPINHTITFNWTPVPGAYVYSLLGCLDSNFTNCPLYVTKIDPPYIWWLWHGKHAASSGVLIHWRVSATGPFGPSSWSDPHPPQSDVITP